LAIFFSNSCIPSLGILSLCLDGASISYLLTDDSLMLFCGPLSKNAFYLWIYIKQVIQI